MKFSIMNFFSKCDQICMELQIWSWLLKKSLMENYIFCAVSYSNMSDTRNNSFFQRVRTFSHSTKLSKTSDLDHLTESLQAEEIPKRATTLITYSCRTSSLKGYLCYKMITSWTVSSEAQVNNFILKKSYVPFLRYSSLCIFNHPMIYQICNIISISAWAR